ncbi:hypothetical protein GIB67_008203 [Kingdonia uniflora]|uniref:Myb/SANT-like domain-containing protein n=1 Tax=Kingdonia uniflora TaxID=39325 RepID=A0A7J7M2E0_9MAGN|nr:hypothetical protein GIB67_008203 [Kingdonia uniflora]
MPEKSYFAHLRSNLRKTVMQMYCVVERFIRRSKLKQDICVMSIPPTIPPPILPKKKGFFQQHTEFKLDFIIKCQAQIDLHRLSGTSPNALAWKTAMANLRGLINRTGHGYDPVSGTFNWPEEVWANIIAVNSEAKKYKTAPLQHRDLLDKLFDGASHTSGSNDDTSDAVVQVLQEMVSSYEIDNALFFKSLKFLGESNEHTYRLMFIRLRPEQHVSFLEALMS